MMTDDDDKKQADIWTGANGLKLSDFAVIRRLGEGSFGEAVLYKHRRTGTEVVLKRVDTSDFDKLKTAIAEIRILQAISPICEPHLLCYEGAFDDKRMIVDADGHPRQVTDRYIATRWIPGSITLADAIRMDDWPGSAVLLVKYILGLIAAVRSIHAVGIAHRDIKPENVIVPSPGFAGTVRLIDFGLACQADDCRSDDDVGSPTYQPPEVALGLPGGNARASDYWSLGLTIWQVVLRSRWTTAHNWIEIRDNLKRNGLDPDRRPFQALTAADPDVGLLPAFWRRFDYNSPVDLLAGSHSIVESVLKGLAVAYRRAFPRQAVPNLSLKTLLRRDPRYRSLPTNMLHSGTQPYRRASFAYR